MKYMSYFIFAIVSLVSVSVWSAGVEILTPYSVGSVIGGGLAYVNLKEPETISSCQNHGQIRWLLDTPGGKEALSVALTAQTTGKKIKVYLADSNCNGGFPVPTYLELVN